MCENLAVFNPKKKLLRRFDYEDKVNEAIKVYFQSIIRNGWVEKFNLCENSPSVH